MKIKYNDKIVNWYSLDIECYSDEFLRAIIWDLVEKLKYQESTLPAPIKCNACGGEMKYYKNEEILIPVGDSTKSVPEVICKCGHGRLIHNVKYGTGHWVKKGDIGCDKCGCKKFQIQNKEVPDYGWMCDCGYWNIKQDRKCHRCEKENKSEVCKCGHLKREHFSSHLDHNRLHCPYTNCECDEYQQENKEVLCKCGHEKDLHREYPLCNVATCNCENFTPQEQDALCKCGHDKKEHHYEGYLSCSLCECNKFQIQDKSEIKVKCSNCKADLIPEAEDFEENIDGGILWKLCPECQEKSVMEDKNGN